MFMCGRRQLGAYSICTLLLHIARTLSSTSSVHGSPPPYIISTRSPFLRIRIHAARSTSSVRVLVVQRVYAALPLGFVKLQQYVCLALARLGDHFQPVQEGGLQEGGERMG